MPLDTAPLSRTRRIAAAGFMLAVLAASLGLAEAMVRSRRGLARAEPPVARIYLVDPPELDANWHLARYDFMASDNAELELQVREFLVGHGLPGFQWQGSVKLAGTEEKRFIGRTAGGEARAVGAVAHDGQHCMMLVLWGDSRAILPKEEALFREICRNVKVLPPSEVDHSD